MIKVSRLAAPKRCIVQMSELTIGVRFSQIKLPSSVTLASCENH